MSDNLQRVTRKDLLNMIVSTTGVARRDAQKCMDATFELIASALQEGQTISIRGFGVFEMRERAARLRPDPRTGETVEAPATRVPRLKLSAAARD